MRWDKDLWLPVVVQSCFWIWQWFQGQHMRSMHDFQTQSLQGWERKPSDPGIFASSQNWCLELKLHRSYDINSRGKIPFHSKIKLSEFSNSRGKESTQGVRESDKTNGQCYWLLWDMCSNLIETWYIKTLQCFLISFAGLGITTRMTLPCFEASHDASGGLECDCTNISNSHTHAVKPISFYPNRIEFPFLFTRYVTCLCMNFCSDIIIVLVIHDVLTM